MLSYSYIVVVVVGMSSVADGEGMLTVVEGEGARVVDVKAGEGAAVTVVEGDAGEDMCVIVASDAGDDGVDIELSVEGEVASFISFFPCSPSPN